MDKHIKILLGIKDKHIEFNNQAPKVMTETTKDGIRQQVWHLMYKLFN